MKNKVKQVLTILGLLSLTIYTGFKAFESESNFSKKIVKQDKKETYASSNKPSVKYSSSKIIEQYSKFDPKSITDTDYYIEVVYSDVDTNIPGDYSVVLKVCYYKGSNSCRNIKSSIRVKEKNKSLSNQKYYAGPIFSNTKEITCTVGNNNCSKNQISKPTAKDPYSNKQLQVTYIDGYVDINEPGTYSLIYYAITEHGVSGTIAKLVTIERASVNLPKTKYITENSSQYYDDGEYAGYLKADPITNISKYIDNYNWYNTVYYTYRCDSVGNYGTDGWTYLSTDTSDNHPAYYYQNGSFKGVLYKQSFNCVEGCTEKLIPELGKCNYLNETKQITRKFVGHYAGYIYSSSNQTYSGTVYLK